MATTRVGLTGPEKPYGTFTAKDPTTARDNARFTRNGLTGAMTKYQTFTPKGTGTGAFYIFGGAILR